jgi:hypothetical protein
MQGKGWPQRMALGGEAGQVGTRIGRGSVSRKKLEEPWKKGYRGRLHFLVEREPAVCVEDNHGYN